MAYHFANNAEQGGERKFRIFKYLHERIISPVKVSKDLLAYGASSNIRFMLHFVFDYWLYFINFHSHMRYLFDTFHKFIGDQ